MTVGQTVLVSFGLASIGFYIAYSIYFHHLSMTLQLKNKKETEEE